MFRTVGLCLTLAALLAVALSQTAELGGYGGYGYGGLEPYDGPYAGYGYGGPGRSYNSYWNGYNLGYGGTALYPRDYGQYEDFGYGGYF